MAKMMRYRLLILYIININTIDSINTSQFQTRNFVEVRTRRNLEHAYIIYYIVSSRVVVVVVLTLLVSRTIILSIVTILVIIIILMKPDPMGFRPR